MSTQPKSFRKTHNNPASLHAEADGLHRLAITCQQGDVPLSVARVISVTDQELCTQWIDQQAGSREQFMQLGQALAQLHNIHFDQVGLERDNFIGLNPQPNGLSDDWGSFFVTQRLGFQVSFVANPSFAEACQQWLTDLAPALQNWLNQNCQHFSLLHGDLWSGNVLFDHQGAWLIDPAVYQGDAEADLAMTFLFGGFPAAFYQGYEKIRPRSTAYPIKQVVYNLYHQLNHYNLFGDSYRSGCERAFAIMGEFFNSNTHS